MSSLLPRNFNIRRDARERYGFTHSLSRYQPGGVSTDLNAARQLAQRIADAPEHLRIADAKASEINAMALMEEIFHYLIRMYETVCAPNTMAAALALLERRLGGPVMENLVMEFVTRYPPEPVRMGMMTESEYLRGPDGGAAVRRLMLEELIMVHLVNRNPAAHRYKSLFDDAVLPRKSYTGMLAEMERFFAEQPRFGPDRQDLLSMLRAPADNVPDSLTGQIRYIRSRWGSLLERYLHLLLASLDFISEEDQVRMGGPGPAHAPDYSGFEDEPERYSRDLHWMPRLVMLAKNTYVWLHQLSREYQRHIHRLDQVPDDVLRQMADRGFTGLWLIGLWERSRASATIKKACGNPEAVASAYSIAEYRIADDLGGESAYENLKHRAWQHGIRMASDMVPNHMGIDSQWVIQHPDWFVSRPDSPFPAYSFTGPDLSGDPRVEIRIEDHYYDRTDAAVVLQRVDRNTGEVRYIYHGNDGTAMPWNDTAQLNYLNPAAREAVIQKILDVARRSPIIRFDAAMTLAKRHFQRLWFPEPGGGGAIPSRSEFSLTKEQFNRQMPVEFWREVVDRVARDAPDTLLLAEAFWLMEGYFVRTLGMHRVYNSAFMNMLRDEDNAKYRIVMKNTLEFDPEILKRFVNFLNNPDERTAVDQFGKDDKYLGACLMMCTLPGLPMFGHGQVEGYTEKYGMEYRRAYIDEHPDSSLVRRHETRIFPLMKKRYLFADVTAFRLYDFYDAGGHVNEDVYAYSNAYDQEKALVIFHNRYASAAGWIRDTAAYSQKNPDGTRELCRTTLGSALDISDSPDGYTLFKDVIAGLWYIRRSADLRQNGLYVALDAYKYHVFTEFQQVRDDTGVYRELAESLDGRGVTNIETARRQVELKPVAGALMTVFRALGTLDRATSSSEPDRSVQAGISHGINGFFNAVKQVHPETAGHVEGIEAARTCAAEIGRILRKDREFQPDANAQDLPCDPPAQGIQEPALALVTSRLLAALAAAAGTGTASQSAWYDTLRVADCLDQLPDLSGWQSVDPGVADRLVRFLTRFEADIPDLITWEQLRNAVSTWLEDAGVRDLLKVNEHNGVIWFHRERFLGWMDTLRLAAGILTPDATNMSRWTGELIRAAEESGYRFEAFQTWISSPIPLRNGSQGE